ncbi:D-alanyl-D-alanine carboxypeptidase/D-alanyl-D-alanine endopeptidase [Sphingomonas sp. TDK1]|uniref:D-alanyl-D-alanine carboxypeptidase/D-alanyl-D-alanine endopeptidase n=1 Tax=Sphingomonas sp. TDK1 TaxID=453247 RepID=UPI0007D90A9A|nr:D-alanyl-D-alanine carboxypeptidase/D-alanyl-D-alanine-endopeptidase [Sphingomonas sp. TDK1]OAN60181.1 D-alanyl-D-alanine carboxypeptidase/D-alanyl-D-alanine-endopeptidase [Sphingomonas sp. TDK1]
MQRLSLLRCAALLPLLAFTVPAAAQSTLRAQVEARLAAAGPGVRFGMLVLDADGREIVSIAPDQRFQPASTAKLLTTAAALSALSTDGPDLTAGTAVRLDGDDVILEGHGDGRLSSADDCIVDCLATLADAVAARTKRVRDVIGDDSAFVEARWISGMSWNNMGTRSGAAVSALSLDGNLATIHVSSAGGDKLVRVEAPPFFTVDHHVEVRSGATDIVTVDRMPFDSVLHLTGSLRAEGGTVHTEIGVDDPALFAAWRLKQLLEARGVRVAGRYRSRHRVTGAAPPPVPHGTLICRATPPPLIETLRHTNKTSDNLEAELLLRRIGDGSAEEGVKRVAEMLDRAGVAAWSREFADGSGMSTYDRVTPRAMVQFLRWASGQPWGAAWRDTLPIGGVDGTLARRFRNTPLAGHVLAKTGTLAGVHALAGYVRTASGAMLTFAIFANDAPRGAGAVAAIDAALQLVAAVN